MRAFEELTIIEEDVGATTKRWRSSCALVTLAAVGLTGKNINKLHIA